MIFFEKKYIARWVVYNFVGLRLKIKSKPKHIDTINLILDTNYGIGNRVFAIINAIVYYTPQTLNIYWDKQGWVTKSFKELFNYNFNCNIHEFNELPTTWENTKKERTIHFPQASLITKDGIERTLSNNNITYNIENFYKKYFFKLEPSNNIIKRINTIQIPPQFVALQVRNAPDWNEYGRNENLKLFINKINEYPRDTIFYLSCMNNKVSNYIKKTAKYKIIELPDKDYNSMYDAVADLYIMANAQEGIYSFGSTFGELAWWLSKNINKTTIIGSSDNWKWIKKGTSK